MEMDAGGESIMGNGEENWHERKIVHRNDHGDDPIVSVIFATMNNLNCHYSSRPLYTKQ